ncbi:MAG: adenylosuccinate lyase, partial [Nitrospirae bacterium]
VDYMLVRLTDLVKNLLVYPANMKRNLELTGGLVYSQRLLLELVERGAQRKESYEAVQRCAMEAWKGRVGFQDLVGKDPVIGKALTPAQIAACFDPRYYLRHLGKIYQRVFGKDGGTGRKWRGR